MIRSIAVVFFVLVFSASVCFGQANSGSGSGKAMAATTSVVSMALGAFMIYTGWPMTSTPGSQVMGWILVIGGGLSIVGGGYQGATALAAKESQGQSGYADYKGLNLDPDKFKLELPDGRVLNNDQFQALAAQSRKMLAEKGVKYNEKGDIFLPNGNTANINDLANDPGAFGKAMGLSPADLNELKNKMNKAQAQAMAAIGGDVKMVASASGASSAVSNEPAKSGSDFDVNSLFGKAKAKPNLNRGVAGLSKMLGGQPIGVAQDDIFKMVSRKYEFKKSESFFIEGDWGQ